MSQALKEAGMDQATVLFVKRHGRLHVEVPGRDDAFSFFREKRTTLDEHGRWQDQVDYFIGADRKNPCDWSTVIGSFRAWLAQR